MAAEFIFVYGTLRKKMASDMHHVLAKHCDYFSDGVMHGRLYEVCGYPGAIESGDTSDKVSGELYKMHDPKLVLARLDEYEECSDRFPMPHEYSRKQLSIELIGGGSVLAWVYIYNHDVSKLQQILSGDYLGG
ncbi:MAG: gamma-glutamylcyclotransferase [Methylococcales bacterium]|nr:gamma-glutamylcyclotransferase [Methylococcales bacterium]